MSKKFFWAVFLILFYISTYAHALKGPVIVSSKIDTEGSLLGSIIALVLADSGFEVTDRIQLGPTRIMRKAVKSSQIDIYPEYTGNGTCFFSLKDKEIFKDFQKGYELVKKLDFEKNSLVWLKPAPVNNSWAIAGRNDFCEKNKIKTMDDFASFLKKGGSVKLSASNEFIVRKDGLPAFQDAYGFILNDNQLEIFPYCSTYSTEKAAASGKNNVNFAMAYGTDGSISSLNLRILKDNKNVQVFYAPAPVVRKEILEKYPEIEGLLNKVFSELDLQILQRLNAETIKQGCAYEAAEKYLRKKGYIKK